jgi:phosphoglucomutase
MKYNINNGGPAPESITNKMYEITKTISSYKIVPNIKVDIDTIGTNKFLIEGKTFEVDVIDCCNDYVEMVKEIFDWEKIKAFVKTKSILINGMNGVTGPYINRIFKEEFGLPDEMCFKCTPLPDFGGEHPDPNLTYAADLVEMMKQGRHDMAAAFDGDGDRNMILGHSAFFVTPCDSLAVIASHLKYIPYFKTHGIKGFARSMPTSGALDLVAKRLDKECFETPTGWKFFGNLMDAGRMSLCGEESFGTGSDHIGEKDGIWAALAWLNIMAATNKSIPEILMQHWSLYGRNYYTRYDYENVSSESGDQLMDGLKKLIADPKTVGMTFSDPTGKSYKMKHCDNFEYTDPIDGSVSKNQGIRLLFEDGSRIVYRLSGTGSSGATIRIYIEGYVKEEDPNEYLSDAQVVLKPLITVALRTSRLKELTGREAPTVIT